jgi:hypothetical protein
MAWVVMNQPTAFILSYIKIRWKHLLSHVVGAPDHEDRYDDAHKRAVAVVQEKLR